MTIEVANGLCGFHAGVKIQRRRDGTMPEKPADNLVRARISLEEEVASQMPELMCRHAHPDLGLDEIGDLTPEQGRALVVSAFARE